MEIVQYSGGAALKRAVNTFPSPKIDERSQALPDEPQRKAA